MIRRQYVVVIASAISALLLSGCYTILQAPAFVTSAYDAPADEVYTWEGDGQANMSTLNDVDDADLYPYGYGPSRSTGVPVFGYDSLYSLYGYGSPYAYGPHGGLYSGGYGYGYSAGPYGYGYNPYYQDSRGSYIPPGYELITTDALESLVRNQQDISSVDDPLSEVERATQLRRQQVQAERAWTQRTQPERRSTATARTTRPPATSTSTSSGVTKPSSSGSSSSSTSSTSESSGSSAAKRRKTKR
jgi:hypothetical protein